jgi:hypothetical protein
MSAPIFFERQHFDRRWWLVALSAPVVLALVWLTADTGFAVVMTLIFLVVVIGWLVVLQMHLDVTVDATAVTIQLRPIANTAIPLDEIAAARARKYRPIREFGGWGVRGIRTRRAYNARGDEGVELTLKDGRSIMIGSQHAAELEAAIGKPAQPS